MRKRFENLKNKILKSYQHIVTTLGIPEPPELCIKLKKRESPNTLGDYSFVNKTINIYLLPIITQRYSMVFLLLHELGHHIDYVLNHKELFMIPTKEREKRADQFAERYYKIFEKKDLQIKELIEEIISIAKKGVK